MIESEILSCLSPSISHFVVHLLKEASFGICGGEIKLKDLTSSCSSVVAQNQGTCDQFKIVIPYAGQTITWEVIFDCNYPEDPPDFICGPEDSEFCPDINQLQHWINWDYRDPAALLNVVSELLDEYKVYQERTVSTLQRLEFEYNSLCNDTDVTSDDVEILVSRSENRIGPIHFLIKLHVEFTRIPPYKVNMDPRDAAALLLVTFSNPEGTRISPQLYLSPSVERALGGSANLRIPGFPMGSCLSEYVPDVTMLLKNKIDQIVQCFEKRKEFIVGFLCEYGRSIIEYDSEGYTKCSFLFEWNDFFFIIHVDLPPYFPKDKPVLTFQSIYHEYKNKPYMETYQDYPYSPRWTGLEMAERTRIFILDQIKHFQKSSVSV